MSSCSHWAKAIAFCAALLQTSVSLSQEMSAERISCQLDPSCSKPKMRGFRGLTVEGDQVTNPNSATFHINFEYDSARLASDALITLDQLGVALRQGNLAGYKFVIAGHTDAKGSDNYNQDLSERRARAVRDYLINNQAVSPERLTAIGFGRQHLLDPAHPEESVNRRVQVITMQEPSK